MMFTALDFASIVRKSYIRHRLKEVEIKEALNVHARSIEYLKDNFKTKFVKK
jgi:uncharacterized protein YpmS